MSDPILQLTSDFAQTLVDCQQLYLLAGRDCSATYQAATGKSRAEIMRWMDDLHAGLLIKVYFDVAMADRRWQPAERALARQLIRHLWQQEFADDELRQAVEGLYERAGKLTLRSVIKPFLEINSLRDRLAQLETVILRAANLITKADGQVTASETHQLRQLQDTLKRLCDEADARTSPRPSQPPPVSSQAIDSLCREVSAGQSAQAHAARVERELSPPAANDRPTFAEALERLHELIGLQRVKDEIRTLANFLKMQRQREQAGLPQTKLSLHLVFTGNPGTGKSSVARIVGELYGAMGVLTKGHLIETDRSGLVAEFAGQTAPKTNALIDQALDGVLFIDEAYSLVCDGAEDAYGREALQTLLKRMEDERDRLAVILAGYPEPMERLLKTNPGLSSRFSRMLSFADYEGLELAQIFGQLCRQNHYELSAEFRHHLLLGLQLLYDQRDEHFGNGRLIRNLFEDTIRRLANRIADQAPLTRALLTEFHVADLQFTELPQEISAEFPFASTQYRINCPDCARTCRLAAQHLGRTVRCPDCQTKFQVEWATPVVRRTDDGPSNDQS